MASESHSAWAHSSKGGKQGWGVVPQSGPDSGLQDSSEGECTRAWKGLSRRGRDKVGLMLSREAGEGEGI